MREVNLNASDLSFLYQCPRCFYNKYRRGIPQPPSLMPRIFTAIDRSMKEFYDGAALIAPDGARAIVLRQNDRVRSERIETSTGACTVGGFYDTVIRFDDGAYGVIDYKTTEISSFTARLYARQLRAYAYALEHAASGLRALAPVTRLALIAFTPTIYDVGANGTAALIADHQHWVEVPRTSDAEFEAFLGEVLTLIAQPDVPLPRWSCPWCAYQRRHRATMW